MLQFPCAVLHTYTHTHTHTHTPRITHFRLRKLIKHSLYKKVKVCHNIFENRAALSLTLKAQRDDHCGRILLGDNTGVGALRFQGVAVWVSAGLPGISNVSTARVGECPVVLLTRKAHRLAVDRLYRGR
jgi:hypothetical protein